MLIAKRCNYYTDLPDDVRLFLNTHGIYNRKDKFVATGFTKDGYMIAGLGFSEHAAKLMLNKNMKAWLY